MEDWIIAIEHSGDEEIVLKRFRGSDKEVKELLLALVNQDKERDRDFYGYGTETADDVLIVDGGYNAYAVFTNYALDYTAKRWCDIDFIDVNGSEKEN